MLKQSFRKHYFLNKWVLISENRNKRPSDFGVHVEKKISSGKSCPFCPGNESMTPNELGRIVNHSNKGEWVIRWFSNKFGAVSTNPEQVSSKGLFIQEPSFGYHYIIVDTNKHGVSWSSLSISHLVKLMKVYSNVVDDLQSKENIKYVVLFKNHGPNAGASLTHEHTQVVALTKVPDLINQEFKSFSNYYRKNKRCFVCDIIKKEKRVGERVVFENKTAVVIAPFAPLYALEVFVVPKRHVSNLSELKEDELRDLAVLMKKVFSKLELRNIDYNFILHHSLKRMSKQVHLYFDILPRLNKHAGFEMSGFVINSVSPETSVKFYRSRK